ncbi:putative succinyldiaminopimelate transaminase DapC [Actinobacteria bacterium YIM 96077]|uniref:Putative succinyldiaminopimelate transaminase DapC n=1 Tax=Phytoactinopolyspora halophila TaxID=1981511 RepID=A0A329R743_9ACTN|nr:pyridoxal phosphate-dependent aminotransferase [Phytoactinopolyspora halophila]AYY11869.1 putative succinyldiaminopimelate transaminase DapC [Actinobacteria bacterium YIM 96077]RAW18898.1 putative succinyldiaminopimelate transaminase DapC [Phytoactinopolyspora halophila]
MGEKRYLTERMQPFTSTIFAEITALATRTGSINLGQGFPDTDGPRELLDAASTALYSGANQYPPGPGIPELRTAVAEHQQRFYDLDVDPDTEVLITTGATEAIASSILALCEPGDEVVTFEPYYDSYVASIALAGAERRTVRLRHPRFDIDGDELRAAFSDRTRIVLLNTPHNPTGKVFTRAELEHIAELAVEHDAVVVTDEVYEHLVFDGLSHVPIATLPQMADRTLTISSAGKTFSVTGWKIGWMHGRAELVAAARAVKQFLTFVSGGPLQPAVAAGLRLGDEVFHDLGRNLQRKRDLLVAGLQRAGFDVFPTSGTYFVIVDAAPLGFDDGVELCQRLPELAGVAAVPVSVFCDDKESTRSLVRFAFCKRDEVLHAAADRLSRLGAG